MKIESVNVDEILGTESKGIYGVHEEEKRAFSRSFSTRKRIKKISSTAKSERSVAVNWEKNFPALSTPIL